MTSEQDRFFLSLRRGQDVVLTLLALALAHWLRATFAPASLGGLRDGPEYVTVALLVVIIWSATLKSFGAHELSPRSDFATVFVSLVKAVTVCFVILVSALFFLKIGEKVSRLLLAQFYALDVLGLSIFTYLRLRKIRRQHEGGESPRHVLVVGSKQRALDLILPIVEGRVEGLKVVGCLELDPALVGRQVCRGVRVLGTLDDLQEMLSAMAVDEVVFAVPLSRIESADRFIEMAERMGVVVRFAPEWGMHKLLYAPKIARMSFEGFAGVPTLTLSSVPADRTGLFLKDVFDRSVAALGLGLSLPLLALIALVVKFNDFGTVLFRQVRSGRNGRLFTMYKFRTMVHNAEELQASLAGQNEMDGPVFKLAHDPRVTAFGRFLRRTSLDELPQLWNVLKGEMSLVGPRPPLPSEVDRYEIWQRRRLSMKPGMTCLWQVSGRNRIGFQDWMRLDLEYIDNWSWALDLRLLVKTVKVVLFAMGDNPVGQTRAAREHVALAAPKFDHRDAVRQPVPRDPLPQTPSGALHH